MGTGLNTRNSRECPQEIKMATFFEPAPRPLTPPPKLSIRVPNFVEPVFTPVYVPERTRAWPVANEAEKQRAMQATRNFLNQVAVAGTRNDRIRITCDLYDEVIRQPILVASNPRFRETTVERIYGIRDEIKEGDDPDLVARYQWIIARFEEMMRRLPSHPWWR